MQDQLFEHNRVPIRCLYIVCHRWEPSLDFSTGAAFFRHLADRAFVQLTRESNEHLHLSLVEDMLSQPILNKEQLQGFQAASQVSEKFSMSQKKNTVVLQHPLNIISYMTVTTRQHNEQVSTDTSQTGTTSPASHTRQHLGPMQHCTTVFAPLTVNTNEIDSDVSTRSRCTQEGRMPSTDGTSGRCATSSWSTGVGTEVHGETTPGFRKDEQESAGRKSTTATDSESNERTPDQDRKGRSYAAIHTEGLGLPGFRQVRSQDVSRSSTDASQLLQLGRSCGSSTIPLETQEILDVAEDAESVFQETNLENNMTQERMTRRIKQFEGEKLFAEMQASKELDQRRKSPKQKEATSNTALEEENNAMKEQVRKLTEQVQLLMASSQEHGAASSAENSAEWHTLAGRPQ